MNMTVKTVEEYVRFLESKGFQLKEDAIGFIYFGKHYTNAGDELVNAALELTLKIQKSFDGSFYMSLLEMLTTHGIKNRQEAIQFVKEKHLLAI
ncbi:DUF6123 family protein [Cytobacillus gottheilii]|uniref:Group-specific protein n=1 Tax=Cytobacillus gottheilii TaxID=859144 RepID=A0ABX8FID0_9BACI|nr:MULTISPECIES: DUF6123 family protein [Bacillaceae]QVY63783.1 hypothetical protein J1899_13795 [Cytobacillus gottheilii]